MAIHPSEEEKPRLAIPTVEQKACIEKAFAKDLKSFTVVNEETGQLLPIVCCVCDQIPDKPNWHEEVDIDDFATLCGGSNLGKEHCEPFYPPEVVKQYTASPPELEKYVLSPASVVLEGNRTIIVCKECHEHMKMNLVSKTRRIRRHPPQKSLANGYLIGEPPEELTCLNEVELALVSKVRIYCQSWIFFAGCHRHVKGWHTFFKNRPSSNVENVQSLSLSGMKGLIMVVLCGPYTSTQKALTMKQIKVDPQKVIAAYIWLRANHIMYKDEPIPDVDDIPIPIIIEENM
jgi:hypothetical protein